MKIVILACAVFEPELEVVLKDINKKKLFSNDIDVVYLPFGLHTDLDKMETYIKSKLDELKSNKVIVLYGSKCHYMFYKFLKEYDNVTTIDAANCLEAIIGPKVKDSYNDTKEIYLTPGWLLKWNELNQFSEAVDNYDTLQQFGQYDTAIVGDTKVCDITEDMIFDLFEKIQIPIEIENTDISIFENLIINAIREANN